MDAVLLTVLLIAGVLIWLLTPGRRRPRPADTWEPETDPAEVEAAEQEVRDLGIDQPPDGGSAGDDWGPGAPGRG
jgi:hypothetical protein